MHRLACFHRRPAAPSALFAALSLSACGHPHHAPSVPPPPPVILEEAVATWPVFRHPDSPLPSFAERDVLEHHDDSLDLLLEAVGHNHAYDFLLDEAADRAGLDRAVRIDVGEDFRWSDSTFDAAGAVSGDRRLVLDGKFLDALGEISVFLVLRDHGFEWRDVDEAIDEIVFLHQDYYGATTEGFLYRYADLDSFEAAEADELLIQLLAPILDAAFGDVFLRHALLDLRRDGFVSLPLALHAHEQLDADQVAGMLVRKADGSLDLALGALDILAYALEQRFDRDFTYFDAQEPWFQWSMGRGGQPAPTERKEWLRNGERRYADYWR